MSLARRYNERDNAALAASGARQIRPRRDVCDWPVTDDNADTFKEVVLAGATAHEAQGIAAATLDKWPAVKGVLAVLVVQAVAHTSRTAAQLLRAQGLSREGLELEGRVLHCQPLLLRGPWECREGRRVTDPALPGHVPCLRWRREAQDSNEDRDGVDQWGRELDAPPPPSLRGAAPHATTARVGITLEGHGARLMPRCTNSFGNSLPPPTLPSLIVQ